MRIIVAITGASGAIYGIKLLESLQPKRQEVHLIMSRWAETTIRIETNYSLKSVRTLATHSYDAGDLTVPIASGSYLTSGMVIVPCTMKTLSAIVHGYAHNLICRAADITIKEKRKLVLVPRETPLSPIHLENMLRLAKMGATILPPMPAFYHKPSTIDDLINHTISRILDHLGIENDVPRRWEAF